MKVAKQWAAAGPLASDAIQLRVQRVSKIARPARPVESLRRAVQDGPMRQDKMLPCLFIAGRTVYTLPRRMWADINENLDPVIAAVAVMLIVVTLGLLLTELTLRSRRAARVDGGTP